MDIIRAVLSKSLVLTAFKKQSSCTRTIYTRLVIKRFICNCISLPKSDDKPNIIKNALLGYTLFVGCQYS